MKKKQSPNYVVVRVGVRDCTQAQEGTAKMGVEKGEEMVETGVVIEEEMVETGVEKEKGMVEVLTEWVKIKRIKKTIVEMGKNQELIIVEVGAGIGIMKEKKRKKSPKKSKNKKREKKIKNKKKKKESQKMKKKNISQEKIIREN